MPLIFGTFLAGALLTCLVPIALLICFATYFYRQARRVPANAAVERTPSTPVEPPAAPAQPSPERYSPGT